VQNTHRRHEGVVIATR